MNKKKIFYLILFVGIFLRILNLGKHSFWCDELLAISIGKHSIKWIIDYITFNDAHPPLFYILIHFWLKFGENEFILRVPSMIFGILCIPAGYFLGGKFKNEKTGILLSLFIALSPALILWSQLVKSYTFFTFLTIFSFYAFLNVIEGKDKKWFVIFVILNTLILYTHNLGFIVILIQIFTLVALKKLNLKFFYSFLVIFLFYIPWLVRIPYQIIFTLGVRRPIPLFLRLLYTLSYFFLGETVNPFNFKILIPIVIIYIILLPECFRNLFSFDKEKKYFLIISLILPLFFVSFPSTVPQNLIPFSIFWFLFYGLGIEKLSYKNPSFYFVFLSLFPSLIFYYTDNTSQYQDTSKLIPFKEIYHKIEKLEKEGDLIFTTERISEDIFSSIQWYYKGKNRVIEIKSEDDLSKLFTVTKNKRQFFLILDFINRPEISEKAKKIFEKSFEKIFEEKYVYNEKLISRLKGRKEYYWLIEVYIFKEKT